MELNNINRASFASSNLTYQYKYLVMFLSIPSDNLASSYPLCQDYFNPTQAPLCIAQT